MLRRLGASAGEADAAAAAVGDGDESGGDEVYPTAVRYVVMSGWLLGGHDAYRAIPLLRRRYEVTLDSDVFSGYFVRSKRDDGGGGGGSGGGADDEVEEDDNSAGVSIQVFVPDGASGDSERDEAVDRGGSGTGSTPLLCRGPTVRDISAVVGDVYRLVAEAGDMSMA